MEISNPLRKYPWDILGRWTRKRFHLHWIIFTRARTVQLALRDIFKPKPVGEWGWGIYLEQWVIFGEGHHGGSGKMLGKQHYCKVVWPELGGEGFNLQVQHHPEEKEWESLHDATQKLPELRPDSGEEEQRRDEGQVIKRKRVYCEIAF